MVCLRGGAEEDCCAVSEWLPTWLSPTRPERAVSRLRKWLILRLVSIVDTLHVEKEEDVIEEVARCEQALSPAPWRGGDQEYGLPGSRRLGSGRRVEAGHSCPLGRGGLGNILERPREEGTPGVWSWGATGVGDVREAPRTGLVCRLTQPLCAEPVL